MLGFSIRDFLINLAADIAASALSPTDMIGYFVALVFVVGWTISWHRKRIVGGKRGVDSWYFIALSLIVAIVAVRTAAYGIGLRSSLARVANAPVADGQSPKSAPAGQKKYFPADIDARIKAIDRLDTIVAGFQPILMQSQEFWNHIHEMIRDDTAPASLTKYENDAKPLLENIDSAMTEYRMRFPELERAIKNTDYSYVVAIPYAASHLKDELAKWSGQQNFVQTIENTKTYDYWDKSIHAVQPWIEKSRQELAVFRQQYASAEVYEIEHQPPNKSIVQPPVPTASVLVTSRYYSVKNKEEVAGLLDKISELINKTGNEILELSEIAINRSPWDRPGEDLTPHLKRMDDIANLTVKMHIALYDEIVDKEREYRIEANSILFPKEPFSNFQIGVNEFRNGLSVWMKARDNIDNAARDDLLRLVMSSRMSFGAARDKFVSWLSQRQELIGQTRRALHS
jgi:hypothetical protein